MSNARLYLVATSRGYDTKVVRAESARGAILGRAKDNEDEIRGTWCAWRLGNFPEQFEVTDTEIRELGHPSVAGVLA